MGELREWDLWELVGERAVAQPSQGCGQGGSQIPVLVSLLHSLCAVLTLPHIRVIMSLFLCISVTDLKPSHSSSSNLDRFLRKTLSYCLLIAQGDKNPVIYWGFVSVSEGGSGRSQPRQDILVGTQLDFI